MIVQSSSSQTEGAVVPAKGSAGEVFAAFLKLGLTSFGGPIAHLGYFRAELVNRRRWVNEATYADLVALCQFLPGPASSQVGFALGLMRAGPLGALAAWLAFTLPSAILMVIFAFGAASLQGPLMSGLIHGLKLVAVAVVAQAVLGMARSLTPDARRAGIALLALVVATLVAGGLGQGLAIVAAGLAGLVLCRDGEAAPDSHLPTRIHRSAGFLALGAYAVLLIGLPWVATVTRSSALMAFNAFYRSGALVFGGGHVVLPLLRAAVVDPGWVTPDAFVTGYGAAQAVPGPLFSFSAYLGTIINLQPNGVPGAALALVAIFLPGLLLVVGVLPLWDGLRRYGAARAAMCGVNAGVVGILAAALYDPVWTSAVQGPRDFAVAAAGFIALVGFRAPPWAVVLLLGAAGIVLGLVG